MSDYDLIIIGAGPAGYTAAIYGGRDNLKQLLIEGAQPGGQLAITGEVENFPGFPEGIGGAELMERMKRQAEKFGAEFLSKQVTSVDFTKSPFKIRCGKDVRTSRAVIIATGASAKWLGLESESKLIGKGVSACATCDGFFFKDKDVVVVGGGDAALEEAIFLTKFARKVTIVHRRGELRAAMALRARAEQDPKIDFVWHSTVIDIKDVHKGFVTGVQLKDVRTGDERFLPCEGVFIAIGHVPNTELFRGILDMDNTGYIKTSNTKTNINGIFAAGDCQDSLYRQAITAAGSGCIAALEARKYLMEHE